MNRFRAMVLLMAGCCCSMSGQTGTGAQSPKGKPDTAQAKPDRAQAKPDPAAAPPKETAYAVTCSVQFTVVEQLSQSSRHIGGKSPRDVVVVSLRGRLDSMAPTGKSRPDQCKLKESRATGDQELPPILFTPKDAAALKVPARIEAVLESIQGFAAHGIPDTAWFSYVRTLP